MPIAPKVELNFVQSQLNIEFRSRTSRLPWRGQFSPELVAYLMQTACAEDSVFLDPFCGSGTVLYEALEKGKTAYGVEVNPAAWHLASLASFSSLDFSEKDEVLYGLKQFLATVGGGSNLLSAKFDPYYILDIIKSENTKPFLRHAYAASVLLAMNNGKVMDVVSLAKGLFLVLTLLNSLYNYSSKAACFLGDARKIPIPSETINTIITSPPYINVFNYHQNYRPATELLGWKPLEAAISEIGSNRKHRQNRFLTVIQYCLDMAQSLDEMARLLKYDGTLILILGKTSNVLGAAFENGAIIRDIIACSQNFEVLQTNQRFFINRFGEKIYEDIIIAHCSHKGLTDLVAAREVASAALERVRKTVSSQNYNLLEEAIAQASFIRPSTLLNLHTPPAFVFER
jgi:DNA modification methylase